MATAAEIARVTGQQVWATTGAPLWGRRLPDYAVSYDTVGAVRVPELDVQEQISLRIDALASVHDICALVGYKNGSELEAVADLIPLSTLESVLKLAYSPHTFINFANPALISACIRLMSTVKRSEKPAVSISH